MLEILILDSFLGTYAVEEILRAWPGEVDGRFGYPCKCRQGLT